MSPRAILESSPEKLVTEAKGILDGADNDGRDLEPDERVYVKRLLDRAGDHGHYIKTLGGLGLRDVGGEIQNAAGPLTPGELFTSSQGFKAVSDPANRPSKWSTGPIEIMPPPQAFMTKGTLLEGAGSPGSGSGGGLLPIPQVAPGVVQTLFQPLALENLLLGGLADGNQVRFIVEGTATSGAAGVAEGGTKPESTLGLSSKDEPVKKIATFLPISDELLEDAPSVQAYLNGRLALFVNIEVERQLLRGTSGGNEVQGILTSRSVPVYTGGTADTKAEQLFKAFNSMRGSAFVEPEWLVMHPTDYQTIRLLKDSAGQYFGGGPFLGPYGNPTQVDGNGQITGVTDTLWGKPVYVTAAIGGAGTALIGTRAGAQVWSRGGLRVEASNSHSTYFQNDLVALRAERRVALTVFRSSAFVEARLAVGPGG